MYVKSTGWISIFSHSYWTDACCNSVVAESHFTYITGGWVMPVWGQRNSLMVALDCFNCICRALPAISVYHHCLLNNCCLLKIIASDLRLTDTCMKSFGHSTYVIKCWRHFTPFEWCTYGIIQLTSLLCEGRWWIQPSSVGNPYLESLPLLFSPHIYNMEEKSSTQTFKSLCLFDFTCHQLSRNALILNLNFFLTKIPALGFLVFLPRNFLDFLPRFWKLILARFARFFKIVERNPRKLLDFLARKPRKILFFLPRKFLDF